VDGGATTSDKRCLKKDLKLSIALKLRPCLEAAGFSVVMTREEDISLHDSDKNARKG
jgi:N-acetylmuramoyl-L-alanine amidase